MTGGRFNAVSESAYGCLVSFADLPFVDYVSPGNYPQKQIGMDLSSANSIFGSSSKVQPRCYQLLMIIKA